MRNIILLDKKIPKSEYVNWAAEDKVFWKKWLGVDASYWVVDVDFSNYPTYIDSDGDRRPTYSYLKNLVAEHTQGYGKYGADFVVMAVHEDNFVSSDPRPGFGIWGTNYSNIYHGYHLQYCRWDKDNPANTFGTIYHERAHSFDALVKTELGKDLNTIASTVNWDREFVHGNSTRFQYIGRSTGRENATFLKVIAPVMREALGKRVQLHIDYINDRISIWQKLLRWFKEWQYSTNGVPKK